MITDTMMHNSICLIYADLVHHNGDVSAPDGWSPAPFKGPYTQGLSPGGEESLGSLTQALATDEEIVLKLLLSSLKKSPSV